MASDLSEAGRYVVQKMKGKLAGSSSAGGTQSGTGNRTDGISASGGSSGGTSKTKSVKASKKYCTVSVKKDGSWKSGKRYYTLYRVTIKNKSKYNISSWKLKVKFKYAIKKKDKWNGSFTFKKNYVTIRPVSWNKKIAPKGKDQSVGFIVSSTKKKNPVVSVVWQ